MFWVPFELWARSSVRAGGEVYYLEKVSFSPLLSSDIQVPVLFGALSIITCNFLMYLSTEFLLRPISHSAAHPVAWK